MKTTIYAEEVKNGHVINRVALGNVIVDDYFNCSISARRYNELKSKSLRIFPSSSLGRGAYIRLVTDYGARDTFGGYPANKRVRFEEV